MERDSQQPRESGLDDSDGQPPGLNWERHPNYSLRAPRIVISDADRPAKLLRVPGPDPPALPSWALARDANPLFPLIKQEEPPFPFVNPAAVMPPTAEEAHFDVPRVASPRLPVITLHEFSAHHIRRTGRPSIPQPPQQYAMIAQNIMPQSQTLAIAGNLPPSPLHIPQ